MPRNKSLLKGGTGRTKITIRPYQKPPSLPENYYETTVKELLEGTLSVIDEENPNQKSSSILSLQNSYTAVVHLVRHQYGPRLYQELRQSMQQAAALILPDNGASTKTSLLAWIPAQYQKYTDYLLLCKHVFLPLDRTHSWQPSTNTAIPTKGSLQPQLQTIWQVGLEQFAARLKELSLDTAMYQEWKQALLVDWNPSDSSLQQNTMTTTTTAEQRQHLQHIWYLWQDLGQLAVLPLQKDLEDYWKQQSERWSQESPYKAALFLNFCHEKYQHVSAWPWLPNHWLFTILEQCLVLPHLNNDYLLKPDHLHPLLQQAVFDPEAQQDSKLSAVQQLWMLAGRLPNGQQAVAQGISNFCRVQGLQRVVRKKDPNNTTTNHTQVVSDLLHLQECLSKMIQSLPGNNDLINLKNVWEEVVNVDTSLSLAESLAKFLDQILRSTKKMDQYQSQSEHWLQRIISGLFVPLQAKDVFEAFYKRDLAKRLLWNRVVSMDVEKQVCSLLKAECGAGFTSKMEGMFQDVDWSRETMMVYKQSTAGQTASHAVDVEVQVLTTGYWPVYPQYPNLNLPDALKEPQDQFANHYKTKYQGRRMSWQYALGHCIVRCSGFPKTYELVVSLCQALVLIQFESDSSRFALPALMQAVGLEDRDEMERILQSLSLGKEGTRVLRKLDHDAEPNKKKKVRMSVDDRDQFEINRNFESNQRRIRINNIMMKETKEEREKTVEAVSRDRLYLIDAVLVRIMKARKTILHQNLIPQVLEQVKVPAQPADVKKRIESLIEREYMERDSKDRNRYNYLA